MLPSVDFALVSLSLKVVEIAAFGLTFICCSTNTFDTFSSFGVSHSNVLFSSYCHKIKSQLSTKIFI